MRDKIILSVWKVTQCGIHFKNKKNWTSFCDNRRAMIISDVNNFQKKTGAGSKFAWNISCLRIKTTDAPENEIH